MKKAFLFLSMLCLCWPATGNRSKRNIVQLGSVISCISGLSVFDVLFKLSDYGCFCGLGGKGTPQDDVDACCQQHDKCYDDAITNGDCPGYTAYTTVYYGYINIDCDTPEVMMYCGDLRSYVWEDEARCAVEVCESDLEIAQCLKYKKLNENYINYDNNLC